jgi:acyl carrier protein
MNKNIFNFIVSLLEKHGPVPGEDEREKLAYRFLETGHIDSFKLNEFIMEIEDQFDIVLSPDDTQSEEFRWVGGLTEIIKNHINLSQ